LAELAWNAFDADAARVGIIPGPDALGGLNAIEITGDGGVVAFGRFRALTILSALRNEPNSPGSAEFSAARGPGRSLISLGARPITDAQAQARKVRSGFRLSLRDKECSSAGPKSAKRFSVKPAR